MLAKLKSIWTWVLGLFTGATASGSIWTVLLANLGSKVLKVITDVELQKLAWNTAVSLHNDESLTTTAKAVKFNEIIFAYVKEHHLSNITTSAVNTLRELAVQAIAVKLENGEKLEEQA